MSVSLADVGTDFFVPTFEISVGGTPMDREAVRDVLSVTFKDSLEAIDTFSLVVNNWDEERRTFKYSDGDTFAPGQTVELRMGYRDGDVLTMLTGEITTLQPKFPAGSPPTLAVNGLSILHRLRKEPHSGAYEDKTDSEVAREVAQRLGVTIETDAAAEASETRHAHLIQTNEQDIVFLIKRARQIGYELTVREQDGGEPTLFFGPQAAGLDSSLELSWGRSLLTFEPKLTTANQVGSVTVRAWHPTAKELIEETVTRAEIGGQAPFQDAFDERREIIADRPVESAAEARQLATESLRRIAQHYVTASGSTVGLPQLRTGVLLEITGLGERFDGTYYVTSTTHSMGDTGYTTSFESRLEPA